MTRSISFFPADDGVQLTAASQLRQVPAKTVQRRRLAATLLTLLFRRATGFFCFHTSSKKIQHLFPNLFQLQAEIHEHLGRHSIVLT